MRAHTMHEKMQMLRFRVATNSLVHVNRIACEHVVAIFDSIASDIPSIT